MTQEILLVIVGVAAGLAGAWFLFGRRRKEPEQKDDMRQHMMELQRLVGEQLGRVHLQMDRRLQENTRAIDESKRFVAERVSAAERSVRSVSAGLGKLSQATDLLHKTSQEIMSFQQLLKNPKVRGSFGEVLLGSLLSEMLPGDRYELQYTYRSSGEIADAIVRLQDGHIVAVDAKFPLANYQLYMEAQDESHKAQLQQQFFRDVKKHISDIAKKYISAQENTLDFAFMYIPIESVYYEVIMRDSDQKGLWEFSLQHQVIPVSPNSLYAYLQTVLVGLRGMKIEQQAREILQHLSQLRSDFGKFSKDFTTVGSHLNNAKNKFDESQRRLDKFSNRLEQIEAGSSEKQSLPTETE